MFAKALPLVLVLTSSSGLAQNDVADLPVAEAEDISPQAAAELRESGTLLSNGEISLTIIIFLFGLISLALFFALVRSGKATPFLMRIFVIVILVFGTLLVVSSAYSTQQIAPVVGFFGTIAGYLLGKSERSAGGSNEA